MAPLVAAAVAGARGPSTDETGQLRTGQLREFVEELALALENEALPRLARYRRLTARGPRLLSGWPLEDMARIQELHDPCAFFDQAYPALVDEWERRRTESRQ